MLNQNDFREKFQDLKGGVKNLWEKFSHKLDKNASSQADGVIDNPDSYEFTPEGQVSTSPRTKSPLSDGSNNAQNLVWDNEDASMQDKSYSFDEETTDADYDFEDDFEFEDDNDEYDSGSGQESRYK